MTGLRISLLGAFAVHRDGQPLAAKVGKKQRALLASLLLNKNAQGRDGLATKVWPDRFDDQARQSLRQALSTMRKAFGADHEVFEARDDRVGIAPGVTCDVAEFEAFAAGKSMRDWQRAVDLYRGELLEGIGPVSDVFDDWLAGERARLQALAADTLGKILDHGDLGAEPQKRLEFAERLVRLDPYREDAHRQLMRAYGDLGRRSAAISQFQACRDTLRRDLDCEPEAATVALYEEIKALGEATPAKTTGSILPGWPRWIRGGLAVAAILVAFAAGLAWFGTGGDDSRQGAARPSIVVLPFETLSGGDQEPGFALGLTEGITTALTIVRDVFVIAPLSAARFAGPGRDLAEITDALGVRHVLEGSVQQTGRDVRVSVRLIDGVQGNTLWAQTFDRELADVFEVQDEIIQEVIIALRVELTEGEQARIADDAIRPNLRSWLIANQALVHLRKLTQGDNLRARALYRQAINIDPAYGGAREGLAWTHFIDARFGWTGSREASLRSAADHLARSREVQDAGISSVNMSLQSMLALMGGDYDQAIALGEQALAAQPGGADVAALLAFALSYTGELERSVALSQRALRLSPRPPIWYWWSLARAQRLAGRPDEAIVILERTSDASKPSLGTLVELAIAYEQAGDHGRAVPTAASILALKPDFDPRVWLQMPPYRDGEVMGRDLRALMAAGGAAFAK